MAICPLPPPDPSGAATPASPPTSLRRRTHAFSKKEKPIQSYKTTTVHLLHTNLQVSLSLLQRQGSDDEDHVLAETVTEKCTIRSANLYSSRSSSPSFVLPEYMPEFCLIARFINACDAVQIRLASEKCNLESLPQSRRQTLIPSTSSSFSRWPLESRLRFKRAAASSLFVCLGSMGLSVETN
ncbi:hypothetical protein F2Q69_00000578 [Brassica cretica]|uniref:Uncharacterized protein n=1 Tax=Brassica cretica TaxID=69181 RepID=A0A8S9PBA7_BRACR|nr:hypothetical protein F2Q69_00000578 [Brassica cretica]